MALLPILTEPDPRLHEVSTPVDVIDEAIRQLLDDMVETMHVSQGIGLAAPQVNVRKRVIVMMHPLVEGAENRTVLKMVNPEIIWASEEDQTLKEGCLSVPSHYADVTRPAEVRVRYLDQEAKEQEFLATHYQAACVQHEIDHLDGILFLNHLSALKRNMILRKVLKEKEATLSR